MTHLSREELIAWRDNPSGDVRDRVVGHLAECSACTATYAALVRTTPFADAPSTLNAADFVARGRAAGSASPRVITRWLVPLAAAASLVMAVLLFRQGPEPEVPVMRGGAALAPRAPMGTVDLAREFLWDGLSDTPYRFELSTTSGDLIHEARVRALRYELPQDVQSRLRGGVDYQWTVAQLDARGDTLDVSQPATFRIR